MSENDRLIPYDLFRSYRRRRQRRDQNEPSRDDVVQVRTQILVKEMLLRNLQRSRSKLLRRLEDLKHHRDHVQNDEDGSKT